MATGTDIISYKGDAGKALAGAPGALSVVGDTDTKLLTQTARDLAMLSFQKNQQVFRQKIADRDAAFKLLDDDALIPDQILEDDRERINGKLKSLQDIFYENSGDIMSDPKKYRDFIKATQEAKNDIKQAQKWYIGEKTLLEDKQKNAKNPIEQKKYDDHLLKMRQKKQGDFYKLPDPYVPTTSLDLATVAQAPKSNAVTVPQGEWDITTTTVDPEATFNQYQKDWSDPTKNHWFPEYIDMFLNGPKAKDDVARINAQLAERNKELGLQPGDRAYITPLGVEEDPLNRGSFAATTDRPDQIAAKIALADAPAVKVDKKFAENRAKVNVDREELAERRRAAKADEGLRGAALAWDKDKWTQSQKGGETVINSAGIFAKRMYDQVAGLGSITTKAGEIILTPDDVRKMTGEQLKYFGIEGTVTTEADGTIKSTGLVPKTIPETSVLVLKDGVIRQMDNAVDGEKKVKYTEGGGVMGKYNPNETRTIGTIGTNRLNEQLRTAGSKELNTYSPQDRGIYEEESVSTSGGGTSQSGGTSSGGKLKASYATPDGKTYTVDALKKFGYTEAQIQEAFKNGKLK